MTLVAHKITLLLAIMVDKGQVIFTTQPVAPATQYSGSPSARKSVPVPLPQPSTSQQSNKKIQPPASIKNDSGVGSRASTGKSQAAASQCLSGTPSAGIVQSTSTAVNALSDDTELGEEGEIVLTRPKGLTKPLNFLLPKKTPEALSTDSTPWPSTLDAKDSPKQPQTDVAVKNKLDCEIIVVFSSSAHVLGVNPSASVTRIEYVGPKQSQQQQEQSHSNSVAQTAAQSSSYVPESNTLNAHVLGLTEVIAASTGKVPAPVSVPSKASGSNKQKQPAAFASTASGVQPVKFAAASIAAARDRERAAAGHCAESHMVLGTGTLQRTYGQQAWPTRVVLAQAGQTQSLPCSTSVAYVTVLVPHPLKANYHYIIKDYPLKPGHTLQVNWKDVEHSTGLVYLLREALLMML